MVMSTYFSVFAVPARSVGAFFKLKIMSLLPKRQQDQYIESDMLVLQKDRYDLYVVNSLLLNEMYS